MLEISPELHDRFNDSFDAVMDLEGEIFRAKEGRRTLSFKHQGKEYFAKIHRGIGWREIIKNLVSFKLPVVDASNEWKAVDLLESVDVATVKIVGKGVRGSNPATRESFVIMRALDERVEVEDFLNDLASIAGSNKWALKRKIITQVADSARRMHGAGMNHRDFYLCHFHIIERSPDDWKSWKEDDELRLPLLDLHRAQIRATVPKRWLIKDLGALYYSALDAGITSRDVVLFLKTYLGDDWRKQCQRDISFWRSVSNRASGFYQKHRKKPAPLPAAFASFS